MTAELGQHLIFTGILKKCLKAPLISVLNTTLSETLERGLKPLSDFCRSFTPKYPVRFLLKRKSVIIKLYKNINGSFHYYEAWDNKKEITVHWGELGTIGNNKTVIVNHGETSGEVIEKELRAARSAGYKEIDIDDHKTLVIQYKTETWGSEKDLEKRCEVEGIANETFGWTGNGHCEGGQIGSGSIEIFSYVIDPWIACQNLVTDLKLKELLEGPVIAYQYENEKYVVLYPKDFHSEFDFI